MQARLVTSLDGARWLALGWRIFKAAPIGWVALVFAYTFLMTLISILPVIGVVAATVLVPGFSVSFMTASRAASRGGDLSLAMLFSGLRERLQPQLALGVMYVVLMLALLGATTLADDGALARWLATGKRPGADVLQSDGFQWALLLAAGLYTQVMMLFWFSPVLVAWHGMTVGKALFFSYFAVLMNWRAFAAYGVVTALVTIVAPFATIFALTAVTSGKAQLTAAGLLFPLMLIIMPTLFGSFYASYRDIFGVQGGA
jgi:hypothetical protein